ncbi:MAG: hypothetical protein RL077_6454 [Verrucomicrobiota bacterium]
MARQLTLEINLYRESELARIARFESGGVGRNRAGNIGAVQQIADVERVIEATTTLVDSQV